MVHLYMLLQKKGLKSISVNSSNLSNYANWQLLSGANGLSLGPVKIFNLQIIKSLLKKMIPCLF
jgi:hypothetical protein